MIADLKIHEFRKFKDLTFVLGRFITVIAGHNATGKSTVLALLGHCAELDKSVAVPFGGSQFRTEYRQIIKVDPDKETCSDNLMTFSIADYKWERIEETFNFRSTIQDGRRYRILPVRYLDNKKTASKIEWPVIYLGLSRLYPLGESHKLSIDTDNRVNIESLKDMLHHYKHILTQEEDITDIKTIKTDVTSFSRNSSVGVDTAEYSIVSNSAGQSNLGQILLSIESFRFLKSQLAEKWNGGLLLVDELDATLHPSAQANLFQYLFDSAKELGIQVCFTTHSLYLLEYAIKKGERSGKAELGNRDIEINYLMPSDGKNRLVNIQNPSVDEMKYDLMMLLPPENIGMRIKVYVEDDEAAFFASELLKKYEDRIEIISTSLGCDNLIKLFKADAHFRKSIILLDGDAAEKIKGIAVEHRDQAKKVMVTLPADKLSPERLLYRFLFIDEVDLTSIFNASCGLTRRNVNAIFRKNDADIMADRDKAKKWFQHLFKEQPTFVAELIDTYKEKHSTEYRDFIKKFKAAFNYLAAPERIPKIR